MRDDVRRTPLRPGRKSGHCVSDYPCWCGDVHYMEDDVDA